MEALWSHVGELYLFSAGITIDCFIWNLLKHLVGLTFYRYTDMHVDYSGQGFDQLLDVINKIKNNPDDRRIILSAWNPADLKLMALPPCHMFAQVCTLIHCVFFENSPLTYLFCNFNFCSFM